MAKDEIRKAYASMAILESLRYLARKIRGVFRFRYRHNRSFTSYADHYPVTFEHLVPAARCSP